MEEVKKSKKQKVQKYSKPHKSEDVKLAKKDEQEDLKEPKKKNAKTWIILLVLVILIGGGGFAAKTILTRTTVGEESAKLADDARGFSNYFKIYLTNRVRAEELLKYSFKELANEQIVAELSDLKEGFSKVLNGLSGNYGTSEYKELAEVLEADAQTYLTAVRELRSVMTSGFGSEDECRAAFAKKVEETTGELRSALYIATRAFDGDVAGFSSKSVLIFHGSVLVEVGGGVMNILLGDFDGLYVSISSVQMSENIKLIDAQKLYGYASTRLFRIGTSLNGILESGWLKDIRADVSRTDVKLTTTRISMVMKNVRGLDEELQEQGIKGLIDTSEVVESEQLNKVVKGLAGK
ncbi:hypothetical protein IK146_02345 [Candidatus Saccharibacteria bacterium]|nr:hypothetical protein [Candidatus Saccharibacteria bacterium]